MIYIYIYTQIHLILFIQIQEYLFGPALIFMVDYLDRSSWYCGLHDSPHAK